MPDLQLSATYSIARTTFLDAAAHAGATVTTTDHPLQGPVGEPLAVDVAELGPATAGTVLLVTSATHGVEGYCGSALQSHWLKHHSGDRPADVRVVMVHALNPYGMAWTRRVNEDNVDLNRNFIDWNESAPVNGDYDGIAADVVPSDWSAATQERTMNALLGLVGTWGFAKVQTVISGGQYAHPKGVFYGGTGPVWSHRWLRSWCAANLTHAKRVLIVDLHTGLGDWGYGSLIGGGAPGDGIYDRAKAIWPETTSMLTGESVSAVLAGDWLNVADQLAPHADVTPVCIEYGTIDGISVLQSLRADAWLHGYGDPTGPDAPAIRAQVRAAFADDNPEWIDKCWPRFLEVVSAALTS